MASTAGSIGRHRNDRGARVDDPDRRSIPSLTGLRGVAAAWVMIYHVQSYAAAFGLPGIAGARVLRDGWMGVDLFFILSGFVLMYGHENDFRTVEGAALRAFYRARLLRIYPLATTVLLLIALVTVVDPGFVGWYRGFSDPADLTPVAFVRTLLLATRWCPPYAGDWNQPTWSVSAELIGYAAFPWIARRVGQCANAAAALMVAALGLGSYIGLTLLLHGGHFDDIGPFGVVRMAGCFVSGVALCRAWRLLARGDRRWPGFVAIVTAAVIPIACAFDVGTSFIDVLFAGLILSLAFQRGRVNKVLGSRIPTFLAKVSFPLYLIHVMLLAVSIRFVETEHLTGANARATLLGYAVVCLALSVLLHKTVERPTQALAHRWIGRFFVPGRSLAQAKGIGEAGGARSEGLGRSRGNRRCLGPSFETPALRALQNEEVASETI